MLATVTAQAVAAPTTGRVAWVIDGDTFRLASGERIRLAGIDAPESRKDQARCAEEIALGRDATRRAIELLKNQVVTFERVGRSYERTVARVTLNGRDVGQQFIAEGIARPWPPHRPKPDWCSGAVAPSE
ncbi:nuclease [Aureimonas ureilytica]|uniref:Nuclease n=1 Tax=Aureimonas ureilytica TaxID=401562 RepID=A0A175RC38_9HYPH|nr:nuclease [Aureimonas ureilytica]